MQKTNLSKKIHLIISVVILIPTAISYGFYPNIFLDLQPETLDEQNFNKAIMGLYLGFVTLWTLGLFKNSFYKAAIITHVFFMLPMALGRFLSIVLDGVPSDLYVYGTIGEFVLGVYGVWIVKTKYSKKT